MIELVAVDYNGTLAPHNGEASPEVLNRLNEFRGKGIKIALITSKPKAYLPEGIERFFDAIACETGLVIYAGGRKLSYEDSEWRKLLRFILKRFSNPLMVGEASIIYPIELMGELKKELADKGELIVSKDKVVIAPLGTSKRKALYSVKKILNVKGAVACIGDGENDLDLLKAAEIPIAVANAVDEVKKAARIITKQENGMGVLEALEVLTRLKA